MKRNVIATSASLLALIFATTSSAQPRPMPPDPYDSGQAAQQAAANAVNNANQPAYPAANDYPAAEVQAVPAAKAKLAAAKAQYDNAQSSLSFVIDQLKEDFEFSADLGSALRNEQAAYDNYVAARNRVLQQVATNTEYQTIKSLYDDLNDKIYNLKGNPAQNKADILATAQLKLSYGRKLSAIEADALNNDSATQDAKAKLIDANAKMSGLRSQFERSVRHDPKVLAAKKEMQDAKVTRVAAASLLEGAFEARDIALNYAYFLHLHDPYTYRYNPTYYDPYYSVGYSPYYGGGYGMNSVYTGSNFGFDPFFRGNRDGRGIIIR